jgi:hypothetical protein
MKRIFQTAAIALALILSASLVMRARAQQSQIEISYEEPTDAALRPIFELLKRGAILEKLREFLTPIRLPRKLTIRTAQCDAPTRPYESGGPITVCYELMDKVRKLAAEHANDDPDAEESWDEEGLINAALVQSALHETALAVFDVFDVPIWGRKFDAADRLAAFIMANFGEDGIRELILNTSLIFKWSGQTWTGQDFARTDSPEAQRFYNYLCMAYGADQIGFAFLVIPKYRRDRCPREYEQIRHAFDLRIMPFVDPDLLVKVKAAPWLNRPPG